jgi:heat shock protein HtpX
MSMKLRLSMVTTLTIMIGLSTLVFTVALSLLNAFSFLTLAIFVVGFNIIQWLIGPYIINAMYSVKEVSRLERPELYDIVERISQRARIRMPKIMIANIPIPNAFAYGSPLTGTRVAVTDGLLRTLEPGEVEAVLGHELGHIKHNDVQVMMFASVLPSLMYYIGYTLMYSSASSENSKRGNNAALLGSVSIGLYFVLTLLSLQLSRLREYYADRHSAQVVDDGANKLSVALAKIVTYTGQMSRGRMNLGQRGQVGNVKAFSNFKALFIADPDTAEKDSAEVRTIMEGSDKDLVQRVLSRKVSTFDSFVEIFSTHPNIVKRLRALQSLQQ